MTPGAAYAALRAAEQLVPGIDTAFKRHLALKEGDRDGIGFAQAPHHPIGPGMQEQPQLVGCGSHAGRPDDGQTGFPAFEVVFRLSAAEADVLVEHWEIALFQVRRRRTITESV